MADGGRCDAGGCEVERLEDRLFCQAHVARCVVLGCGHAAVPGAQLGLVNVKTLFEPLLGFKDLFEF